jgi:hypothetical protein
MTSVRDTAEGKRLAEAHDGAPWRKWGPYLSERQWGTVREDYSKDGNAWGYFSHDQARSRAYRWGEDGLAGVSDDRQQLCFAVALWNGRDPILKERLFGLTNSEGNHGEDVKEYYFYLDSTPTHSYMKYLYKYPQAPYPYDELIEKNRSRTRNDLEYELLETGIFDGDRYFDVFVEYAKAAADDLLIRITAVNRGPERAELHVLPSLWFRNTWWLDGEEVVPSLSAGGTEVARSIAASHVVLGDSILALEGGPELLFTNNETNTERIAGEPNKTQYVKDGINGAVVDGRREAVDPEQKGTKAAAHYREILEPGETRSIRLRLSPNNAAIGADFDAIFQARQNEADGFYAAITPDSLSADQANVMRQALAGMMWSKQYYLYDVDRWLDERGANPFDPQRNASRNNSWHHMYNADVISMPDKWEYPWYAAWDLAFHVISLTLVDDDFGKQQLELLLRDQYLHPNGQLPAYEWNFSDVNPPVHAWSTIFTYRLQQARNGGDGDLEWLERVFQRLLLNFTWWVNRKDRTGNNLFEGGFLGLDNIGVFDRSSPLPTGGYLEQADGTAWMALFCQNMTEIAAELARHKPAFAEMVYKFVAHFLWIATSMMHAGNGTGMWDEEDGFFYDVLRLPDGSAQRLKVRSMVGLLPLCAVTVFDGDLETRHPDVAKHLTRFLEARPELRSFIHDPVKPGYDNRRLASVLDEPKLRRVLAKMLDEEEFLSPFGIRSLSKFHAEHPYVFNVGGAEYRVAYLPNESDTGMFGGNSNWRGPIWMPMNALIIRALLQLYLYYGNDFMVECPTGSGNQMNLYEVSEEINRRLSSIFLRGENGGRPVFGGATKFQEDPEWRDHLQFYEYFHGDNGAGLGANHQTGWTGLIARGMHLFASTTAERTLEEGKIALATTEDAAAVELPA